MWAPQATRSSARVCHVSNGVKVMDQSSGTRSFRCRELLWSQFAALAQQLNCSVDFLINDAMKRYGQQRSHYPPLLPAGPVPIPAPVAAAPPASIPWPTPPPRPIPRAPQPPPQAVPLPPAPAINALHLPQLHLNYRGQYVPVNGDRFVIGRGRKSCDLVIKDANVSRQHALIEVVAGQHFIVDLGSTNGLEYRGGSVQRQRISQGDVFSVCGHDFVFAYR